MGFNRQISHNEWKKIQVRLCTYLGICGCQRKLKGIVEALVVIHDKVASGKRGFTGAEFLICAMLEKRGLLEHGINCEYPILYNSEFWDWIMEIKDNEDLEDN
jgi:hypothetical protein